MWENEKIKSNLQVVICRSIKVWSEKYFVFPPGVIFLFFFVFEIFGYLREDFLKFHGPPKRLRIIIFHFCFLRFADF